MADDLLANLEQFSNAPDRDIFPLLPHVKRERPNRDEDDDDNNDDGDHFRPRPRNKPKRSRRLAEVARQNAEAAEAGDEAEEAVSPMARGRREPERELEPVSLAAIRQFEENDEDDDDGGASAFCAWCILILMPVSVRTRSLIAQLDLATHTNMQRGPRSVVSAIRDLYHREVRPYLMNFGHQDTWLDSCMYNHVYKHSMTQHACMQQSNETNMKVLSVLMKGTVGRDRDTGQEEVDRDKFTMLTKTMATIQKTTKDLKTIREEAVRNAESELQLCRQSMAGTRSAARETSLSAAVTTLAIRARLYQPPPRA